MKKIIIMIIVGALLFSGCSSLLEADVDNGIPVAATDVEEPIPLEPV